MMKDFDGKRVTVMGLGRFGGGVGVTRWLAARGAIMLITDTDPADKLSHSIASIQPLIDAGKVRLELGRHEDSFFIDTDAVVANAAVPTPWNNRFLGAAQSRGVPILTEIGLAVAHLPSRSKVIGITGSVGKSTTTALVHHMLSTCGVDSIAGGNIGGSLLAELASGRITDQTWVVLELSSAMLHWLAGWSPSHAVVTTFEPNHIDWHGSVDHYRASKMNLLRSQVLGDRAVLGPSAHDWPTANGVTRVLIPPTAGIQGMAIPGAHNAWNGAIAVETVAGAVPTLLRDRLAAAARTFKGLAHRLEYAGEAEGVRYFNDSKSTTPGATLIAANSFDRSKVHLISGGYDKKIDLSPISKLAPSLAGLYTIGDTGPQIAASAGESAEECVTLEAALARAAARAKPGDVIVLSPGCASWDQFTNFEARGDLFRAWVATHTRSGVAR